MTSGEQMEETENCGGEYDTADAKSPAPGRRASEYITINYHTYATFRDFLKLKNMKRSIRRQRVFQSRLLPSLSYVAYALPTTYVGCCSPVPISKYAVSMYH